MANRRNKIVIKLEGRESDEGHVLLSEFVERLESLRGLLRKIDLQLSGDTSPSVIYQITSLSHSSPATVEVEAKPMPKHFDRSEEVLNKFVRGLDHMREAQQAPDGYDYDVLNAYKKFVEKPYKSLQSFSVSFEDESPVIVTDDISHIIDKAISAEYRNDGSMSGLLEAINIHDNQNKFTIYPIVGPNKVVCHFPASKLDDAIAAINSHVCVYGSFKYRKNDPHPHEVEVTDIEIYPPDDELPSLSSFRGIAPNIIGDQGSVQFVRKIRDRADT